MDDKKQPSLLGELLGSRATTRGVCLGLASALTITAISHYKVDAPACQGGWGPCYEQRHIEQSSTATGGVTGSEIYLRA